MNMALVITCIYEFRSKERGTATATKALQKVLTRKIADQKKTHSSDFECVFLCFKHVHYFENNIRWTYNKEGNKK
jgi:hypothetical protein